MKEKFVMMRNQKGRAAGLVYQGARWLVSFGDAPGRQELRHELDDLETGENMCNLEELVRKLYSTLQLTYQKKEWSF